jgi:hypothetical protein
MGNRPRSLFTKSHISLALQDVYKRPEIAYLQPQARQMNSISDPSLEYLWKSLT